MKAFVFSIGLLCLAAAASHAQSRPWIHDQPCGSRLTSHPISSSPDQRDGCQCADTIGGIRVCQCFHDGVRVVSASRGMDTLTLLVDSNPSGPVEMIEAVSGDIDGDGVQDVVVPVLTMESQGMAVDAWTIYVLPKGRVDLGVDSLETVEYNTRGSWVRSPGERGCSLLVARWVGGEEPVRGAGLYFEATWYQMAGGWHSIRADRPTLRRRYTYAFERERGRTRATTGPFSWLLSPQAHP